MRTHNLLSVRQQRQPPISNRVPYISIFFFFLTVCAICTNKKLKTECGRAKQVGARHQSLPIKLIFTTTRGFALSRQMDGGRPVAASEAFDSSHELPKLGWCRPPLIGGNAAPVSCGRQSASQSRRNLAYSGVSLRSVFPPCLHFSSVARCAVFVCGGTLGKFRTMSNACVQR